MRKLITTIMVAIFMIAVIPGNATAELEETYYDSEPCNLLVNGTQTWFNYSDDEHGRSYMEKENASLNASFRCVINTTAYTVSFNETNLKTIMIEGHPPPDFMPAADLQEFKESCKAHGSMRFYLNGTGTNTWVFMNMPDDIVGIILDNENFDNYTYEDGNLTITISMSSHVLDVLFDNTGDIESLAGIGLIIGLAAMLVLVAVFVMFKSKGSDTEIYDGPSNKAECKAMKGKWDSKNRICKRR